jgi:hydroxylamine reductase (hybrid-cluster protein)
LKLLGRLVLGILVLVVLAAGGLYVAAQQKPAIAQGLRAVPASSAAAQTFDDKVNTLQKAADTAKQTGKEQTVEVSFTEEELTSKAAQAAQSATSGIAAQDTQIHLSGSQIIATSTVTVSGVSVNLGVVAEPIVVNGQTQIVIKEVQTGALGLPDAIKDQINAQIGKAIDPSKLGLPIDVSQLSIVDGKLVIKGTAKP